MTANKSWYAISNKAADSADVEIYDEIGGCGISAKQFIKQLKELDGKKLNLRINSPGGSIADGQAIISALNRHKGGFTASIDGLAASMASVIACAAEETLISEGGIMMIHRAQMFSAGDADDLRKDAAVLEKFEGTLLNVYEKKTGLSRETIQGMLDEETWMDATDCVALGFCDGVVEGTKAAALLSKEDHKNRFDNFKNRMSQKTEEQIEAEKAEAEKLALAEKEGADLKAKEEAEKLAKEEAEKAEAEKLAKEEEEKKAKSFADSPSAIADRITALVAENKAIKTERDSLKAELESVNSFYQATKKALGLNAAENIPVIATANNDGNSADDLLATYEAMPRGKARSDFFAKHKNQLQKLAQERAERK